MRVFIFTDYIAENDNEYGEDTEAFVLADSLSEAVDLVYHWFEEKYERRIKRNLVEKSNMSIQLRDLNSLKDNFIYQALDSKLIMLSSLQVQVIDDNKGIFYTGEKVHI